MLLLCAPPMLRPVPAILRATLHDLLERSGLWGCFDVDVTANDGMETISESLLSAAIKLGRPPNRCVSFSANPEGEPGIVASSALHADVEHCLGDRAMCCLDAKIKPYLLVSDCIQNLLSLSRSRGSPQLHHEECCGDGEPLDV